jgi:hypothetical protein
MRTAAAVPLVLSLFAGCAYVSHQPHTPARKVSYKELNEPAVPGERYYLLIFGSETFPKVPRFTHSWITFIRVPADGTATEHYSISWMPSTLFIKTFRPTIEPGVNLTLHESIEMALHYHERISMWGPYEIPPGLYRKFMIQKRFLESGEIGYQCIDTVGEAGWTGDGSNCIHAISDGDVMFTRQAYPLTYFGDTASLNILRKMAERGAIPDVKATHDEVLPSLKIDDYPIVRREYSPPLIPGPLRFGPFTQPRPGDPGP